MENINSPKDCFNYVNKNSRFVMTKARKDNNTLFNQFWIRDNNGKVPVMYFLAEEDMCYVFDLLNKGKMVFEGCL